MAEYIEREAAIKICSDQYKECLRKNDWCGDTVAWNIGFGIKAIPASDVVEVKRGEWMWDDDRCEWVCDRCSIPPVDGLPFDDPDYEPDMDFCPNCGADMREVDHAVRI